MSRFLRRINGQSTAEAPDSPVGTSTKAQQLPTTSEVLVRPVPGCVPPKRPEPDADRKAKLAELRSYMDELHAQLKDEDPYKQWEARFIQEDSTAPRYMRAAKWDLKDAKKRIQGTIEWRREYQPELIPPEEVCVEAETGKHVITGFDNEARPLLYLRPGRENTKPSPRQIRYLVWSLERAIDLMPVGQDQLTIVVDYASATSQSNPSLGTARKVLNILQNHYVERLGRAFVVNVPWFINAFFTGLSPFLDPVTKDKIRFNAPLKDFIPPEQLDAEWEGGLNRYKFDYEVYWKTFVDFCGIAADGTRVHETYARSAPPDAANGIPNGIANGSAIGASAAGSASPEAVTPRESFEDALKTPTAALALDDAAASPAQASQGASAAKVVPSEQTVRAPAPAQASRQSSTGTTVGEGAGSSAAPTLVGIPDTDADGFAKVAPPHAVDGPTAAVHG